MILQGAAMPESSSCLALTVHEIGGITKALNVEVTTLFNFGYAGRSQASVIAHVEELVKLGLPAPSTVPSVFPLPPLGVTTAGEITVAGGDSYGEVEYALLLSKEFGWLVAVASDHSDFAVEKISTPRSKAICPDVLSPDCWRLIDVEEHWDSLELTCTRSGALSSEIVQAGELINLLPPRELIAILESRLGTTVSPGTVLLSGTLAGEPAPGGSSWQVRLHDPHLARTLVHDYAVTALQDELS
jgi:hypothetical protein